MHVLWSRIITIGLVLFLLSVGIIRWGIPRTYVLSNRQSTFLAIPLLIGVVMAAIGFVGFLCTL